MNDKKRIEYLQIALNLQGVNITKRMSDQVIVTFEAITKKGDKFTLKDAVEINVNINRKYEEIALREKQEKKKK